MKHAPSPELRQATVVIRFTAGILALLTGLAFAAPLSRTAGNEIFLAYQCGGVLLSALIFVLTFERHFSEYWHIEAALFFGLSLLIWSGVGLVINNPIPLSVLIVAVPIASVLLPWDWQFQLGICGLCIGAAVLASRLGTATMPEDHPLWMVVAAESAIAVLASVQLELRRRRSDAYFEALVADEEQFRALIENAPDALCVFNTLGSIVFQSPSAKRMMGSEDLTGRSAYEFLHHDDAPTFRSLLSECVKHPDRSHETTVRCRHADGSWRTVQGVGKRLDNYSDEPLVVLNWRDVTERALQESRVRQSEEKFHKIFQYSTNAISIISRSDGRYIDVNDEWLKLFGYTQSEVIGKDPLGLGRWADPDEYLRFATELLTRGEVRDRAAVFRAKDGLLVRGLISSVILEAGGAEIVLSVISIPPVVASPAGSS
jgi:PAS domain S-box-containing protein